MSLPAKTSCCLALLVSIWFPLGGVSQATVASPSASAPVQRVQPYSATVWTTITQPLAKGSTRTFTQRIEVSRDSQGNWTKAFYRPTNGVQYDISAPLDHTAVGLTTSARPSLAPSLSNGETLDLDEDLGTRIQNGLETQGRRRTFLSVGRQPVAKRILETWYSPQLAEVIHSESHNFNGSVVVMDLTNLQLGSAASAGQTPSSGSDSSTTHKPPSDLQLYHALFSIVAHMERDRLAKPPTQVGDMAAVEESLRKQIGLPRDVWQAFVTAAVKVDAYTEQISQQARAYARQGRQATAQSVNKAQTMSAVRVALRQMQVDQDARMLGDIKELEANAGTDGTTKIHTYLHGPLVDSAHVTPLRRGSKGAQ